jgi:serine/threonine protein kinase/WD40 repeat protein/tetratricopeptide (TPR) repeat protein
MMPRESHSAALRPADPAFDLLVDRLIARLQAGEAVDWPVVAREHPHHAGRLRSLAVALEALGDLSAGPGAGLSGTAPRSGEGDLRPGVLGDFHILREVGRGGMAVVYEAEQVSLCRRVALKVLPLAATMDPRQLERFRHEARAAGLLHHPHIVPVYGVGCERGVHYYAMQLIEGCSLAAVIDGWRDPGAGHKGPGGGAPEASAAGAGGVETPPLAARGTVPTLQAPKLFRRIAELVAQAADALEHAHALGVVHRDIKPANLLVDAGGKVWITDFGLARLGEGHGLTASGDLLGTLRYMSPEQALARHGLVDHRTDIYSLGATLYELLTLHPAVDGASKEEVLHHLAFEEPVAPRRWERSIPAELETVTLKALAKDPAERYATAQEMADDLRRWLTDRPIRARPPGPLQRLRKWSRRHRPLVVALGAFLVLLVAGLCLGAVAYGVKMGELADKKGELADERGRLAEEKERSERKLAGQLRQVLVDRAEALRLARAPGYRRRVWADLHQAMPLPASGGDVDQVRATVLACLGDPVGLDPIQDVKRVRRQEQPRPPAGPGPWSAEAAQGGVLAVSAGGDRVAVAGPARRVAVYSRQGKPIWQEASPLGAVYDLAWAADGKLLAAGCEQGFVAWDLAGPDRWLVRAGNVFSVAVSPSGRLLAAGGRQLELWSVASRRLVASWPPPEAGARVEFSADGRTLLAVANGAPAAGWPVSNTPERRVFDGHSLGVPAVAFSPDGRQLASVSKDRTVRLWDVAAGRPLRTLPGHPGEIEAVAFHPGGSLLATGDLAGSVRVWDAQSGGLLAEAGRGGPPGEVWRLQFGPGGEYLAAAGQHVVAWTVQAEPGKVTLERLCALTTSPGSPGIIDLAARPGGTEFVYLNRGGRLYSYDLARADDPRLVAGARATQRSLHFTPGGDRLAFLTTGGTLGVWDWRKKEAADTGRRAEAVAVSADGRWAAVVEAGRHVAVVELGSGREVFALPPEGSDVWCLAWAPDGTKLAVGLSDGAVVLWDLGQVRTRLSEFGIDSSSTARAKGAAAAAPVPEFDRVVRVNRLRCEAESFRRRAAEARDAGDHAAERDSLMAALDRDRRLAEAVPDAAGHRRRLAGTHGALARALTRLGDTEGALRHLGDEAGLLERLLADDPRNPDYRRLLASHFTDRSRALDRAGQKGKAVDDARHALADREKLAADPATPLDREQLAVAYHNLGFQLSRAGQRAEAESWYRAALAAEDRLAGDVPTRADTPSFRTHRGNTLQNLAILRAGAGDPGGAEKVLREAAAVRTRLADDFPANPGYASDLGRSLEWLGIVLRDLGRLDESDRVLREAFRRQGAALALRPKDSVFRFLCCNHQANRAITLLRRARPAAAAAAALELPRLAPDDPAVLFRAASLLARCVPLAERDPGLPWGLGPVLAEACRGEAVARARRAVARGLADAARQLSESDFKPVRDCPEFRRLLDELKAPKH